MTVRELLKKLEELEKDLKFDNMVLNNDGLKAQLKPEDVIYLQQSVIRQRNHINSILDSNLDEIEF